MCAKLLQSHPTLCDPMNCSPSGSSVHGILRARILEWVAISSSRGSSWPRDRTHISYVSYTGKWVLHHKRHVGSPVSVVQFLPKKGGILWRSSRGEVSITFPAFPPRLLNCNFPSPPSDLPWKVDSELPNSRLIGIALLSWACSVWGLLGGKLSTG